jgi:hypothetical protein
MPFLPDDYELPTAVGNYMKLQPGSNRFRVMGSFSDDPPTAVMGWLAWTAERQPVRFRMADKPAKGSFDEEPKHFWAMAVWNVNLEAFQILELTQKSILDELTKMINDKDWGDPNKYDVEIFRIGEGKETKYSVNPKPHSEISDEAKAAVRPINLNAFFDAEDPFEFELTAEAPAPVQPDF